MAYMGGPVWSTHNMNCTLRKRKVFLFGPTPRVVSQGSVFTRGAIFSRLTVSKMSWVWVCVGGGGVGQGS